MSMSESEFLQSSDILFQKIENQLDEQELDLDCQISGNVVTLENDEGQQVIINRHLANQELWIAAKSGGYHFSYQNNTWQSTRNKATFMQVLNQVVGELIGEKIHLNIQI